MSNVGLAGEQADLGRGVTTRSPHGVIDADDCADVINSACEWFFPRRGIHAVILSVLPWPFRVHTWATRCQLQEPIGLARPASCGTRLVVASDARRRAIWARPLLHSRAS
jgi:hypothetical protein